MKFLNFSKIRKMNLKKKLVTKIVSITDKKLLSDCIENLYGLEPKVFKIQDAEQLDALRVLVLVVPQKKHYEGDMVITDNSFVAEILFKDETLKDFLVREKARFTPRAKRVEMKKIDIDEIAEYVFDDNKDALSDKNFTPDLLKDTRFILPSLEGTILLMYPVEKDGKKITRISSFKYLDAWTQSWRSEKTIGEQVSKEYPDLLKMQWESLKGLSFQIILSSDKTRHYTTGIKGASIFISHTFKYREEFEKQAVKVFIDNKQIIEGDRTPGMVSDDIIVYENKHLYRFHENEIQHKDEPGVWKGTKYEFAKVYDFPEFRNIENIPKLLEYNSYNGLIVDLTVYGIRKVYFFPRPEYLNVIKKEKPHYKLYKFSKKKKDLSKEAEENFDLLFDLFFAETYESMMNSTFDTRSFTGNKLEQYLSLLGELKSINVDKLEPLKAKKVIRNKIDKANFVENYEALFI